MNARPFLAACLVGTTLLGATPGRAYAQEAEPSPAAPWVAPILRPDALSPRIAEATTTTIARTTASLPQAASPTTELLSRGARIAIIVSAIVLGVIILVGIFTIGAPHHP